MKMECNIKEKMELLIKYMECKGGDNSRQKELLQEIVVEMREGRNEDLVGKIYLYGSMIRGKDRLERYIFLMLLRMAGALEPGEVTEERALMEALKPRQQEEEAGRDNGEAGADEGMKDVLSDGKRKQIR